MSDVEFEKIFVFFSALHFLKNLRMRTTYFLVLFLASLKRKVDEIKNSKSKIIS